MDPHASLDAEIGELAAAVRDGSSRALSRGLSWIEAGGERAQALIEAVYAGSPWAHVVGVTGAAGAGKSTLVASLAKEARRRGLTVGILAIDPSSPFTGGAILGDRVRMSDLSGDASVFMRSMAARGEPGGLCQAASGGIDLLRAAGKQLVLVETVGVGQDEVDIMHVAHTTVVVSVPGLGDDVQAMKAGLFEIADIHVVNKADRDGAGETVAQIEAMLHFDAASPWPPPVLRTVALKSEGVAEVMDAITLHAAHLNDSRELESRERRIAEARVLKLAQTMMADSLRRPGVNAAWAEIDRVARRDLSPYACAKMLLGGPQAGDSLSGR